jgi:hypothetical protein
MLQLLYEVRLSMSNPGWIRVFDQLLLFYPIVILYLQNNAKIDFDSKDIRSTLFGACSATVISNYPTPLRVVSLDSV